MKTILDIAESVATILMFFMAVWGTIVSFEEGFWHKLNHIVDHYHQKIDIEESHVLAKTEAKAKELEKEREKLSNEEKAFEKQKQEYNAAHH